MEVRLTVWRRYDAASVEWPMERQQPWNSAELLSIWRRKVSMCVRAWSGRGVGTLFYHVRHKRMTDVQLASHSASERRGRIAAVLRQSSSSVAAVLAWLKGAADML